MRLILVRHAKSSWNDSGMTDHDRPLAPRGIKSARRIGQWLGKNEYHPRQVMCSTAVRAKSTWAGLSGHLPEPELLDYVGELYGTGWSGMFRILQSGTCSPVVMIGHNTAIGVFASEVVRTAPRHPEFHRYPTAATLVCDFPADCWSEIRPGTAGVVGFVVPRELGR